MKWINLKNNKCPQCNKDFSLGLTLKNFTTLIHHCGFMITQQRYNEIVSDMVSKQLKENGKKN